jgi:hypothetical protein
VENNLTRLLIVTNSLAFAGVLLDVTSAFLCLVSSMLLQSNMLIADGVLADVKCGTCDDFNSFYQMVYSPISASGNILKPRAMNSLGKELMLEMLDEMKSGPEYSDNGGGLGSTMSDHTTLPSIASAVKELDRSTRCIVRLCFIGHAAGTATLFGILSFLISVVCLAIATQPRAVWICAVTACSGVVILPVSSWLLMPLVS